jgi:hypothetical protein
MGVGLLLFALTRLAPSANRHGRRPARRHLGWAPWLIGMTIIGYFGRYGNGARGATPGKSWALPEAWDLITVCICCLIIFYWAVSLRVNSEHVAEMVAAEEEEIRAQPDLNVA